MTLPPSYDRWVTGGAKREATFLLKCPNPKCSLYDVTLEIGGYVEYGYGVPDQEECEECVTLLVDDDEHLPSLEELLEPEEPEEAL